MVVDVSAQTEEYILQEEQYRVNWQKKYGGHLDRVYALVGECLSTKTTQSRKALLDFFSDKELIQELSQVNDFAFVVVAMEIYSLEIEANVKHTIFEWANDLQGLINIIRQVKFLLWEIEFLDVQESGDLLLNFMDDVGISMTAFEYLVFISSYDKEKMVKHLNVLFS